MREREAIFYSVDHENQISAENTGALATKWAGRMGFKRFAGGKRGNGRVQG